MAAKHGLVGLCKTLAFECLGAGSPHGASSTTAEPIRAGAIGQVEGGGVPGGPDGANADDDRPGIVAAVMEAAAGEAWERWVAEGGPGDASERVGSALLLIGRGLDTIEVGPATRRTKTA